MTKRRATYPQKPRKPVLRLPQLWLHGYAVVVALATWSLIWIGGLVTSKGVGMAVPDWPTTFGENMFTFPIHRWIGGVFWEHFHRLLASGVGLMTVLLAVWVWAVDKRKWMRALAAAAVLLVVLQGVLGGLRVTLVSNHLGWVHGCVGQIFLGTMALLALGTSVWWRRVKTATIAAGVGVSRGWLLFVAGVTLFIVAQLIVGAGMRHAHLGLAIPDFPTAYGSWWPEVDEARLESINRERSAAGQMPTTLAQIELQMLHRVMAVGIVLLVVGNALWVLVGKMRQQPVIAGWSAAWAVMVAGQFALGAWTVWSGKHPYITTGHVALGALMLMTGVLLVACGWRLRHCALKSAVPVPLPREEREGVLVPS